ncbi:MAG: hypothetical protein DLM57_18805 [Pseudonocardiales bacterium]|nr:MAG: hypothetical protein DLM57_18805 [Pseudonocardiales bacterium]
MAQAAPREAGTASSPRTRDPAGLAAVHGTLARLSVAAPELVAAAVAGFSIGPMILLLAGAFTAPAAIGLGVVGALAAMVVSGLPAEPVTRRSVQFTGAAAVLAVAWFAYNVRYYAQDVYATRDPAVYGLTARWLMEHSSLNIPVHADVFGTPPGATLQAAGFQTVSPGTLHAQGNHLVPALMSLAGSTSGATALLQANVALGALALFVLFGLARRIVGAPLALLVMTTLAVSMPFLYVSRDAFSEPLMLLFLMGGLALLHRAVTSWRVADFALAGFVAACSGMARVDSYGALLAVVVAAIAVAASAGAAERGAATLRGVAVIAGGVVPVLLGWLDLAQLSRQYYGQLHNKVMLQLLALLALVVAGPAIAWLGRRPELRARLVADGTRRRITVAAAAALLAGFAFLASRPLWQQTHTAVANVNLENMQRLSGVQVDGTRLYNEQSVNWQASYLGWSTVLLAAVGYPVLVAALVRRRCYALVGTVVMGLIMSGLYLWDCQIVADQPWASRRFVPVVIPLLLVAAAAALRALWSWQRGLYWARAIAVVAAGSMLAVPLWITAPVAQVREEGGQLAQLQAICAAVGRNGAVVTMDLSTNDGYAQAIRSYCGVPTIAVLGAGPEQLVPIRAAVAAHGRALFLLSQDPATTRYASGLAVMPFSSVTAQRWPNVINRAPTAPTRARTVVFLSTVDAAGLARPVPAR